jgi:hypothetical protein
VENENHRPADNVFGDVVLDESEAVMPGQMLNVAVARGSLSMAITFAPWRQQVAQVRT